MIVFQLDCYALMAVNSFIEVNARVGIAHQIVLVVLHTVNIEFEGSFARFNDLND